MAGEFKGLTVKFRGDDSELSAALHRISEDAAKARGNARDFQRALRFDPGNTDALKGKIGEVSQQFTNAKERVEVLEQALEQMDAAADPEGFRKWTARLEAARADAERLHMQLLNLQADFDVQTTGLGKLSTGLQDAGGFMSRMGEGMAGVGDSLTTHVTAPLLAAATYSMKAGVDIDTALTGVRKTVDATEQEYDALRDAAIEYSKTNAVSATDTLNAEELAGQLGVAKENLEQFAHVATGLDIATNMNVEQASTNLARFANLTNMGKLEGEEASRAYEAYGNVIVGLGNNLATTESEISDFSLRMASAGTQAGMSEPEIMGIAGAMSSLGLEAQAGGSAFSKTISDISIQVATGGENLEKYAQVAGTTADEFAKKWKDDAAGAFVDFINGLATGSEDINVVLEDLGISELRQSDAMRRLAGNTELVSDAMELANEQWDKGTALSDEVANKNDSQAAKWQMVQNRINAVAAELGGPLADAALDAIDAAGPLIEKVEGMARAFSDMSKKEQLATIEHVAMVAAAGPVLSTAGRVVDSIGKVTTGIGKGIEAAVRFRSALKGGATAGEALGTALKLNSAVALPSATAAFGALGIAIAGIGLAAAAKDWMDARERAKSLDEAVSGLSANTEGLSAALFTGAGDVGAFGAAAGTAKADIDGLLESVSEHNRRNAETRDSAEESIYMLGQYKAVIDECAGAGEADAETTAKLEWALRGLEDATGEAWSAEQVLTGEYEDQEGVARSTKDAIDELIESKQREARVNALEDMYTDALKEQAKAEVELTKAEETYNKQHEIFMAANEDTINSLTGIKYTQEELETLFAKGWGKQYADDLSQAQVVVNGLNDEVQTYANLMGEAVEQANANWGEREGIIQTTEAMKEACDAAGITNEGIKELAQGMQDAGVSTQDFAAITGEQFAAMVEQSGGDLDTLVGLIADYANRAPGEAQAGAQGVADAVAGSVADTQAAADQQRAAAESAGDFDVSGEAAASAAGVPQGIRSQLPQVETAAGNVNRSAAKMGDIKGMQSAGAKPVSQLASGIRGAMPQVSTASGQVASATNAMQPSGNAYGWGSNLVGNLIAGIRARISEVSAASAAVASAAKSSIGHSVPKEGPLHEGGRGEVVYGEHMVDNLVAGMRNRIPEVRRASREVAAAASSGLSAGGWSQKMYAGPSETDLQTKAITSWLGSHLSASGGDVYVTLQYDASADANEMVRDVARILHDHNALGVT